MMDGRQGPTGQAAADPDRFLNFTDPGAQEWWYFDAISDDRRDVLVLIWFAALPFDPAYGTATLRHMKDPNRYPAPRPLDHAAISVNWYRDGKLAAYALNSFNASQFEHDDDPFRVSVGGCVLRRGAQRGYDLRIETPAIDRRNRIEATLRFLPASHCEPFERNLGTEHAPHHWMLAAADGRLEGELVVEGGKRPSHLIFQGRGYHDHNAGVHDLSISMRRWSWGRVHDGTMTHVYYHSEPRSGFGKPTTLWLTFRNGQPRRLREAISVDRSGRTGNLYGVRHERRVRLAEGVETLTVDFNRCVDDGPFYRRWVSMYSIGETGEPLPGISELLVTRNLHSPLFNWMIPYRLKRPSQH